MEANVQIATCWLFTNTLFGIFFRSKWKENKIKLKKGKGSKVMKVTIFNMCSQMKDGEMEVWDCLCSKKSKVTVLSFFPLFHLRSHFIQRSYVNYKHYILLYFTLISFLGGRNCSKKNLDSPSFYLTSLPLIFSKNLDNTSDL